MLRALQEQKLAIDGLRRLQPIAALSNQRLSELADLCFVERVSKNLNPFRVKGIAGQMVFLLRGELALVASDGGARVLVGGLEEALHPIGRKFPFCGAKAVTEIELLRIDDDLLDIMATWDQIAGAAHPVSLHEKPTLANWAIITGMFSIRNLQQGPFAQLPPAHISELLTRFERIAVSRGQVIVQQGTEGDYYYLIETGNAVVDRSIGGVNLELARLKDGDAFGEEALVAGTTRNASVRMLSDGRLLRLAKEDFNALLKAPLLRSLDFEVAQQKIASGAHWLDLRFPPEYQHDPLPGALNLPLSELRNAASILDKKREYVLYCQTGRRSSAAAFLLAQRGYQASVLE
ncbi:MAG TPA: cyclic nucleotide-binding domain-containing protein, partial [Burkholderiales bacterium]|nr:cyclic nucleotide-binding domain-containing protein [Burkholderiales bacterium]